MPYSNWLSAVRDARQHYVEAQVKSAITGSCVGDAANAISNLRAGYTVDQVLAKFGWLYGSAESLDSLMQDFYRMTQKGNEKTAAFALRLEEVLSTITKKYPNNMTEVECDRHMLDRIFYGMKDELRNALRYKYDGNPNLHYSKLVMAAREIENKIGHHAISKAAVTESPLQAVNAQDEQANNVAQQLALLMSAITSNQGNKSQNNGGGKFSKPMRQGKRD